MTEETRNAGADPWQAEQEASPVAEAGWERKVIVDLATAALREQRRARRWGIFFKFLIFAYLLGLLAIYRADLFSAEGLEKGEHVALVKLTGVISDDEPASAANINRGLRAAFEDEDTRAVVLGINSPGGSPVQSGLIYDEIRRLRAANEDIKVYAVISDIGASGGYFVAAAADAIYANPASVVGSIGVRMGGFGFVEAMEKFGVERRLLTAGDNKAMMDPFSPLKPGQTEHMQALLDSIHQQFIDRVREGRGERLTDHPDLFSGLVWTGEQALSMGLVDGMGSARSVARDVVGVDRLVDFTPREDLISRIADRIGAGVIAALSRFDWQ